MKIRNKLSLLFSILSATILLIFAGIIYYSAVKNRETEFYNNLKKEAVTKANLFFTAKVDAKTLQTVYRNNRETLNEVEAAIYDTAFNLLYHDAVDIDFVKESRQMIDEINLKKEIKFYQEKWQVIGLLFPFEGEKYIITVAAYDQYGYIKLSNLNQTIWVVFVFSILLIYMAGRYFSLRVLNPVKEIVKNVKNISASNLDLRLSNSAGKDEISELANTFNEMLDRLEKSFDTQKQFVSNISHEIRTPLSSIIAELELSLNKERSNLEYKSVIENTLKDAQKLTRLSNSLLDFAKANYDPSEISYKKNRLDEILLDSRKQVLSKNNEYQIDIHYENEIGCDDEISVMGNEYLLKVAFVNLFENGCKFSEERKSTVSIQILEKSVILLFKDSGIGIPDEDLIHLFSPFFRGKNKNYADGNGIGLSLTYKIITLHNGIISVSSRLNEGTIFKVQLTHI